MEQVHDALIATLRGQFDQLVKDAKAHINSNASVMGKEAAAQCLLVRSRHTGSAAFTTLYEEVVAKAQQELAEESAAAMQRSYSVVSEPNSELRE